LKLQKKNNKLLSTNVRAVTLHSELEIFFLNCIEEIKKSIISRNRSKIPPFSTLEDFRKEDKLNLLIMMLEND
jgi:hypothetical protein